MYQLSVKEQFVAQHYLTVPDCGPENIKHSHIYSLELLIEGKELDQHGYLVDIDVVKEAMAKFLSQYRDITLNDTVPFKGLNPSVEHFARIAAIDLSEALLRTNVNRLSVKIWEDYNCWASYTTAL